jgi:hypothetical protein
LGKAGGLPHAIQRSVDQFHRQQSWSERAVAKVFQIEMSAWFWTVGLHRHALHMAM